MRSGLALRVLLIAGVVIAFLTAEFALVVVSFGHVRQATAREERANRAVIAASRVEKLVLDLETGVRGYVITRDARFLQPYRQAQRQLPAASAELRSLMPGSTAAAVDAAWRSYVSAYAQPLVRIAASDRTAAATRLATGEGKRRIDRIRNLIDPASKAELAEAAMDRHRVSDAENQGIATGVVGIVVTILLFSAALSYLMRSAIGPLRRIAAATAEVAAGRAAVVDEDAPGEVGQLAAAFNEMSRSLARSRGDLAEQNVDLERLANLLRAVLDATVDGILLSDRDGAIQLANRPMVQLANDLGMTLGTNVVDNLLSIANRMTDPESYRAAMDNLRGNPDGESFDEFELADTGRVFQGFTSPVRDARGGFIGRIWTLREVTRQRELDRLKDEFVATVSHELRTPLTSMMGFLEMVRDGEAGELNEEQERFLAIVYRSSERLQRLVGDLLFVARLDADGLQMQFGAVDLAAVVNDIVEQTGALARSHQLRLEVDVQPLPAVRGDRERIAQVLGNLLSNAVKFTPPGGRVEIAAFVAGETAVVEVRDTGIGIPAGEQERLFERFFRSSTATQQAIPGTGLGLVIAKAIADAHGGSLGVRSQPDVGTCFRLELPLAVREVAA